MMNDETRTRQFSNFFTLPSSFIVHRSSFFGENVWFHLVSIREPVHLVEQSNDRKEFAQPFLVESQPLHGGSVGVDSVRAAVGHGDCQRDNLLGQQVKLTGAHDCLEARPAQLEVFGVRREGTPDVGNSVDFLRGLDVVENRSDFRVIGIFVH